MIPINTNKAAVFAKQIQGDERLIVQIREMKINWKMMIYNQVMKANCTVTNKTASCNKFLL